MTITLGIDTGGTYTDAVLVAVDGGPGQAGAALAGRADAGAPVPAGGDISGPAGGADAGASVPAGGDNLGPAGGADAGASVLAGSKALTTRRDLSLGISHAVTAVFEQGTALPDQVDLVALSTTLATNAIVEGQGSSICLLLIGYDSELIQQLGFDRDLATRNVVFLSGGHDVAGDQVEPLDEAAAEEAIRAHLGQVEAFAVSGYFGVRNPAHELRVRELVRQLAGPDFPVTCGHELTTRLNSVRRATTAALNARLIPLLHDLIAAVRRTLEQIGVSAPLMVVKGDGSLVGADWALRRPIETILSGPAASVVGASKLAGRHDVWVVDMGGTTTDMAALRDGRPRLDPKGAQVGRWKTMVEAVDVRTVGLGGDSEVRIAGGSSGRLTIGPRRVVPLCLLASQHPEVVEQLGHQVAAAPRDDEAGQFVIQNRRLARRLMEDEEELWALLENGPRPLHLLVDSLRHRPLVRRRIEQMEAARLVLRSGFTPTDALHCLGRWERWDAQAARLGAELLARQADLTADELCHRVVTGVSDRVTTELVSKVLSDEEVAADWDKEPAGDALLQRALETVPGSDLVCRLGLARPVVAVGAPVEAFFPRVARQLHTELVIPPHADVASAVGAVVGAVVQELRVLIQPLAGGIGFRVHLAGGVHDYSSLPECLEFAHRVAPGRVKELARRAGAGQVEVKVVRHDSRAPIKGGWGAEIYLGTELIFTAVGRPSVKGNRIAPGELIEA